MQISQPLGFYFPGSILCVDDNLKLLENLQARLPAHLNIKIETNPLKALDSISNTSSLFDSNLISLIDDSDFDQELDCPINISISKILQKSYSPNRFTELTVLVVDQSMPEISGIEVCEKLKGSKFRKIMLTGEAGNGLAIDAFNKGLIDHFISKEEAPNELIKHLESAINHLQHRYFQQQSGLVISAISVTNSFLKEETFLKEFNIFLQKYSICEFYMLDTMGSFLGLDESGKAYWFLVRSQQQIENQVDIASSSDIEPAILDKLKNGKNFVYFLTPHERDLPIEKWSLLLHPISKKNGQFSIAIVEGNIRGFDSEKVISLKSYLDSVSGAK